jgi:hypothetical protein
MYAKKPEFAVTNAELHRTATLYEKNTNNNNVFNGRNLSDHSKVSNFYALKAQTPYQSPLLYFGQNDPSQNKVGQPARQEVTESNMVKTLFTGATKCDDCKEQAPPPTKVSNLLNQPAMNSKYSDAWFLHNNPQYWNNIRTAGLLKDLTKQEDDPVL